MISEKKAFDIYCRKVEPKITYFNKERSTIYKKVTLYAFLILIIIYYLIQEKSFQGSENGVIAVGLISIALIFGLYWLRFRKEFKFFMFDSSMKEAFPGFEYKPRGDLTLTEFNSLFVFYHDLSSFRCDDQISGYYGRCPFKICEFSGSYKSRSPLKDQTETCEGLVIQLDFNKVFKHQTVVLPKDYNPFSDDWVGADGFLNHQGFEDIKLENPRFADRFVVKSTSQIESRYILTPSFMEKVLEVRDLNHTARLSFSKGYLYLVLDHKKDLFEPKFFGDIYSFQDFFEISKLVEMVPFFFNAFDLEKRIWTKQ